MCTDLQLDCLPRREGHHIHASREQSPGERQSGPVQGAGSTRDGEGGRETSHQSPAVSEWEGEREKPGNTWGVASRPMAQQLPGIWSIKRGKRQPGLNKLEGAAGVGDHLSQLSSAARPSSLLPAAHSPVLGQGTGCFTWLWSAGCSWQINSTSRQ